MCCNDLFATTFASTSPKEARGKDEVFRNGVGAALDNRRGPMIVDGVKGMASPLSTLRGTGQLLMSWMLGPDSLVTAKLMHALRMNTTSSKMCTLSA